LIFIDETGFDKNIRRKRGRSRKGKGAVQVLKTAAGVRLNLCCAVSPRWGIVHYEIITGSYDQYVFSSFLTELMKSPVMQTSKILILDGVKWHHTVVVHDTLNGNPVKHRMEVLPAYSPHLNSIEYCFSMWKADIRKEAHTKTSNLRQQIEDNR
jgi:transposase